MTVEVDIEEIGDIAFGVAILGTDGESGPHVDKLVMKQAIEEFGPVKLLPPDELDADDFVIPTAQMDTPTVSVGKFPSGQEAVASMEHIERELGETADATMPIEYGDISSAFPFAVTARHGLPMVDIDSMRRAFPELQHGTSNIYDVSGMPATVSDEQGSTCLIETGNNDQLGWLARGVTIRMGGVAYVSDYPMTGTQINKTAIPGTASLVENLGRVPRLTKGGMISAVREVTRESIYSEARSLPEGGIVNIQRRAERGFTFGHINIDGLDDDEGSTTCIEFRNENLGVMVDGSYVAIIPDLITVLDREMDGPVPTESLRYEA